ncbi:unnamed protein product, partial [Discosporangium mesarthrocarpum]
AALRQQQQRLLLLRHASKCPHETDPCNVTPHCRAMKQLWKHIAECKIQTCDVPHCVSSRFVLSHYHRCKKPKCAVCAPVREVIAKSHQRQIHLSREAGVRGNPGAVQGLQAQRMGSVSVGNMAGSVV